MLFFWSVYDGIISYYIPILITSRGFPTSTAGLLISLSAVSGAVFDFLISKLFRRHHYLRFFFLVFIFSLTLPLLLWSANTFAFFALAMVVWGLIYDLLNFAIFDLSPRISAENEHTKNISLISIFKNVGYFFGPLIVAFYLSLENSTLVPISFTYVFLCLALVIFVVVFSIGAVHHPFSLVEASSTPSWFHEIANWKKIGHLLLPVLVFNIFYFIFEATFWTLGPLYSQQFPHLKQFSGFFMAAYILPAILATRYAQSITDKFGKKRTAYVAFVVSSLSLAPLAFTSHPYLILSLVMVSTLSGSLAWSAINGAFIDYLAESQIYDNQIIGLKDLTANMGYILGPTLAGVLSDLLGIGSTFALLGLVNAIVVIFLFLTTPKHITLPG